MIETSLRLVVMINTQEDSSLMTYVAKVAFTESQLIISVAMDNIDLYYKVRFAAKINEVLSMLAMATSVAMVHPMSRTLCTVYVEGCIGMIRENVVVVR